VSWSTPWNTGRPPRPTCRRADAIVAFVEDANQRSRRVHVEGFGMLPLGEFVADGRTYGVVAAPAQGQSGTA
jgi:hypothetical protein